MCFFNNSICFFFLTTSCVSFSIRLSQALSLLHLPNFLSLPLFTGHVCLTDDDKDNAKSNKGSLLYGELLPRGANKVRTVYAPFSVYSSCPPFSLCPLSSLNT
jgi:hypothetical protein